MSGLAWDAIVAHLATYSRRENGVSVRMQGGWLVLATTLCPARMLRPRCAMIAMSDLPMGSIGVVGDSAVFTHTMPVVDLTLAMLDVAVRVFTEIASELVDAQGFVDVEDPTIPLEPNDARFAYLYW